MPSPRTGDHRSVTTYLSYPLAAKETRWHWVRVTAVNGLRMSIDQAYVRHRGP